MYQIDTSTAATTQPAPAAAGTPGWFRDGQPGVSAATELTADWFNMVQAELLAVVTAAGLPPSKTALNQVLTAIQYLISQAVSGISVSAPTLASLGGITQTQAQALINASLPTLASLGGITQSQASALINTALSGLLFQKSWSSGQFPCQGQFMTFNLSHNLGVVPKYVQVLLICVSAQYGFSPGQIIDASALTSASSNGGNWGGQIILTNTTIVMSMASTYIASVGGSGGTSGQNGQINYSDWNFQVNAWA